MAGSCAGPTGGDLLGARWLLRRVEQGMARLALDLEGTPRHPELLDGAVVLVRATEGLALTGRAELVAAVDALGTRTLLVDDSVTRLDAGRDTVDDMRRLVRLALDDPTRVRVGVEEAEAAVAVALDADDLALVAELLMLWPLLGLPWRRVPHFAWHVLESSYDERGSLRTSLAQAVLCALLLTRPVRAEASDPSPAVQVPELAVNGARWRPAYDALPEGVRRDLAPLLVTVARRRARDERDLSRLTAAAVPTQRGRARRVVVPRQRRVPLSDLSGRSAPPSRASRAHADRSPRGRQGRKPMEPADTVTSLVERAREGDQSAWDDLVERFLPLVCGTIARHGLRGAEADDVNQTVWLRLVEHLDEIREPRALPGWIATTCKRECLRAFDRSRRVVPVDPQDSPDLAGRDDREVAQDLLDAERHDALLLALEELPEDRRELLMLLLVDPPLPYREISARLGIPIGSIGPTRARALDQLRSSKALRGFLAAAPEEQRR